MDRHFNVTGYILNKNKVLLIKHKKLGKWLPLGGHIEANELPEEAMLREIKEEAGIDVKFINNKSDDKLGMIQPLGIQRNIIKEDHEHLDIIYSLETKDSKYVLNENEGEGMGWFTLKEIEKLDMFELTRWWINKLLNR